MRRPLVGETLYMVEHSCFGRDIKPEDRKPRTVAVTKVGRKYFEVVVDGYKFGHQFRLDDWREHCQYSSDKQLFASLQEWENEIAADRLWHQFRKVFNNCGRATLSLEQLRAIKAIISDAGSDLNA